METNNPTFGHIPMDVNFGISNRLEKAEFEKMMTETLTDLANVLKDHCGPYGKFSAITSVTDPSAEPVFTKDGINILRAIHYASPVQEFVRHTLMYMGSRVETSAGDGTTSAMIIMAIAMVKLLKNLKKINCTYQDLVDVYNISITEQLDNRYKDMTYTVDYLTDKVYERYSDWCKKTDKAGINKMVIKRIAYSQAYTSSHGDEELSSIIATMFADTPKEMWNLFTLEKASYETTNRYTISEDVCQWKIEECTIFPLSQMTEDFGTKCIRENIKTILTTEGIAVGNDYTADVRKQIEEAIISGEPLAVLQTGNLDAATNMWLTGLFNKYPNHKVCIVCINPGEYGMWNDIPYIAISSGKEPKDVMEFNLDFTFNGRDLTITKGIFKDPDTSKHCHQHPCYGKMDKYPTYNDFVARLKDQIEAQESVVATRTTNTVVSHMKKMLSKLVLINRMSLHIGGSAYDNAAAVDVAVDTIQSVRNTLVNGFALGSNRSMWHFMNQLREHNKPGVFEASTSTHREIVYAIADAFTTAIEEAYNAIYRFSGIKKSMQYPISGKLPLDVTNLKAAYHAIKSCRLNDIIDMMIIPWSTPPFLILQPISTDQAILKRFGESALRFVKTERVISDGGIYVNKHKKG